MPCFQATDARSWRIITTVQQTTSSIKGYCCCCCFFFKILPNITFTYLKDNESSRETGRSTEWYILLTGCSLWTEVHLWQNTVLPECLSSMTRLGYSHTHTHTHACTYSAHCRHIQVVIETPGSQNNWTSVRGIKRNSPSVCCVCYRTASAKAPSSIFLTDLMFRPFALKHTFVSNEWRYNQSLCQCQTQWQIHSLPL